MRDIMKVAILGIPKLTYVHMYPEGAVRGTWHLIQGFIWEVEPSSTAFPPWWAGGWPLPYFLSVVKEDQENQNESWEANSSGSSERVESCVPNPYPFSTGEGEKEGEGRRERLGRGGGHRRRWSLGVGGRMAPAVGRGGGGLSSWFSLILFPLRIYCTYWGL